MTTYSLDYLTIH